MRNTSIWSGVYDESLFDQYSVSTFNKEIWLEKQTILLDNELQRWANSNYLANSSDYIFFGLVIGFSAYLKNIKILDFGGGVGLTYLKLISFFRQNSISVNIDYHIVDLANIIQVGQKKLAEFNKLRFSSDLEIDSNYDVVLLGSSLHYVKDYLSLIKSLTKLSAKFIVLCDIPAGFENKTFITLQKFYTDQIPVRFWNFRDLVEAFSENGYMLYSTCSFENGYLSHMEVFDKTTTIDSFKQIVFIKS